MGDDAPQVTPTPTLRLSLIPATDPTLTLATTLNLTRSASPTAGACVR